MLVRLAGAAGGVWDALWPELAAAHALAAVDLPPPDPERPPRETFARYADLVLGAADALGHPRCHLVGWNGGAHIVLSAAHDRPERVASLVLLAPFRDVGERRQIEAGLDLLEHLLRTGARETYARHWFMAGFSDTHLETRFDEVEALIKKRLANDRFIGLDVDRAMTWMRALRRDHLTDQEVRRVAVPALIMAPGQNRWHAGPTAGMGRALHDLLPMSELDVLPELGAFFPIEAAGTTAARIAAFVAGHRPGNG